MKVLVWTKKFELKNSGGPMGYCYNIKSYLDENPCESIDFYPSSGVVAESGKKQKPGLKRLVSRFLSACKYTEFFVVLYRYYIKKIELSKSDYELLEKYDFVHVHLMSEILQTFQYYKGKAKVVLTTHTPEPMIDELIGRFNVRILMKFLPFVRTFCLKKEALAYQKADYIMFPVPEAREPYVNRSRILSNALNSLTKKTFYVPTSVNRLPEEPANNDLLEKFNIPSDSLKVCYVGRHNEVKGYDFLRKVAKEIWKKENVYFVVGGTQAPLKGLNDKRWIELGWVKTPELLNCVDVFILPNKETYFDIILLEVLRQGIPVIISKTGGNKWFVPQNIEGIKCFEYGNIEDCISLIQQYSLLKKNGRLPEIGDSNKVYFCKELSMARYVENYVTSLEKLS